MKKIYLFLFLIGFIYGNAQYFQLDQKGLYTNDSKEYVIIDFPDIKKEDLYKKTLSAINKIYRSGKEVASDVENESIVIHGIEPGAVDKFTLNYKMNLLFKDGKMRIDTPSFEMYTVNNVPLSINRTSTIQMGWWIYSRDGKLNKPKAKEDLEVFFNTLIGKIKNSIEDNSNW